MSSIFGEAMSAGDAAMRRGSFFVAMKHFENALTEDPASALAHAALSLCLTRLNRRFGAEVEAERAISLEPELPVAQIALGYAALNMGDPKSAYEAVALVRRADPDDIDALELACVISHWERKAKELHDAARDLLQRDPENPVGKYMLSFAASLQGKGREAEELARDALRVSPEDHLGHEAIGWAFLAQGKANEAKQAAYNTLRLAPDDSSAAALLAGATVRSRPLTGWMFIGALWIMKSSERAFLTFALIFMATTTLAGNVLQHYEQMQAFQALDIACWVIAIVLVGSVLILNQIIRSEARNVRLSPNY